MQLCALPHSCYASAFDLGSIDSNMDAGNAMEVVIVCVRVCSRTNKERDSSEEIFPYVDQRPCAAFFGKDVDEGFGLLV